MQHNLFIGIFTPLTSETGNTAYYIDEFGMSIASRRNGLLSMEQTQRVKKYLTPYKINC
jgi:hypothetical protein